MLGGAVSTDCHNAAAQLNSGLAVMGTSNGPSVHASASRALSVSGRGASFLTGDNVPSPWYL